MRYIARSSRSARFIGQTAPVLDALIVGDAPDGIRPAALAADYALGETGRAALPLPPLSPAPPAPPVPGLYGVFQAGPYLVAVSIDMVREVVPRPARLTAFPSRLPEVLGAIELRGTMIPVVDFSPLLGGPSDNHCTVIMVVRIGNRLCGLLIDHIYGVEQLDEGQFTGSEMVPQVRSPCWNRPPLVLAGFAVGNRSGIVMNCAALTEIEGLPLSLERTLQSAVRTETGEPTLLFSAGPHRFGLAAQVIDASIPRCVFEPTGIDDPVWVGMLPYKGALVPVADTLALLGLGRADRPGEGACVIVRLPQQRLLALRIDRVHDMQRILDSTRQSLQDFQIGRGGLLRSLIESDAPYLLIDLARLMDDPLVQEVAAIGDSSRSTLARETKIAANEAFLVMAFGAGRFAAPMGQVEEIIPASAGQITLGRAKQGIVGLIAHRGRGVPLYNLSGHIGIEADDRTGSFIVIASHEGRHMGFPINGLCSVERVPLQRLGGDDARGGACGTLEETICAADGQTSCVVDLQALVGATASVSV